MPFPLLTLTNGLPFFLAATVGSAVSVVQPLSVSAWSYASLSAHLLGHTVRSQPHCMYATLLQIVEGSATIYSGYLTRWNSSDLPISGVSGLINETQYNTAEDGKVTACARIAGTNSSMESASNYVLKNMIFSIETDGVPKITVRVNFLYGYVVASSSYYKLDGLDEVPANTSEIIFVPQQTYDEQTVQSKLCVALPFQADIFSPATPFSASTMPELVVNGWYQKEGQEAPFYAVPIPFTVSVSAVYLTARALMPVLAAHVSSFDCNSQTPKTAPIADFKKPDNTSYFTSLNPTTADIYTAVPTLLVSDRAQDLELLVGGCAIAVLNS